MWAIFTLKLTAENGFTYILKTKCYLIYYLLIFNSVKCVEKREVKMPSVKSASNADYNRSRNDHRVVEN